MQYYKIPKNVMDQYLIDESEEKKPYTTYSQRDPRWANVKLGFGSTTIGSHGCFVTSLSMMVNKRPDEVNEILKKNGGFNGDLVVSEKAAQALGLEYFGKEYDINKVPDWYPNIKEVRMNGYQHFVLRIFEDGKKFIIDPWTGTRQRIDLYPFKSYRLFKK